MAADEETTVGEKIEARLAAIEAHLGIGNAAEPQETVTETTQAEPAAAAAETTPAEPTAAPAEETAVDTTAEPSGEPAATPET